MCLSLLCEAGGRQALSTKADSSAQLMPENHLLLQAPLLSSLLPLGAFFSALTCPVSLLPLQLRPSDPNEVRKMPGAPGPEDGNLQGVGSRDGKCRLKARPAGVPSPQGQP